MLRRVAIAAFGAVAAALSCAVAQAQIAYLPFGTQPADLHARAVELFSAEAGAPVDPALVIISPVDLSGDGQPDMIAYARTPAFCNDEGCAPRFYYFDGMNWIDILEPGLVRTRAVPGAFTLVNVSGTGFSDVLAGSMLLVFDGERYVEEVPAEPTELDMAAFAPACAASPRVAALLADVSVPDGAARFCGCVGALFERMGHQQDDLDAVTAAYAGSGSIEDDDELDEILADYEFSCRADATAG